MLGFIQGDLQEERSEACLADAVNETLLCLARDPAKDGTQIETDVPADLWAAIRPIAIQQVLLNLILNAIEAISPGPGKIIVSARRAPRSTWNIGDADAEGEAIEISVQDTGRGIAPEIQERIFEPLVSFHSPGSQRKGTGLGLSICRRLVQQAGGGIDIVSAPNEGTTFTLRLPIAKREPTPANRAA